MNMELICDLNVSYFPQALVACTLEFQIEGGGGGGGINGDAGKNTAIRNFIEMKSSNDLVKMSTKRT